MDKKNMTYELRIKAIIDEAQRSLGTFEKQLKTTWENGLPPKHMSKSLEGIRARLTSLQEIAKKGVVDSSDLAIAESDYKAFAKIVHDLSIEFKLLTVDQKKAMLSEEEQRAMASRTAAVKEYTKVLEKNRDVLRQRESIKTEKEQVVESQKARRSQLEKTKSEYETKIAALTKKGPRLSSEGREYEATLPKQEKNLKKIRDLESELISLRNQPASEENLKDIEKREASLKKLKQEQESYNKMAGKANYDAAVASHKEVLEQSQQALSDANKELADLDSVLDSYDKKLKKLSLTDVNAEFQKLKEELKELGVEGIEDAKSIDEVKKAVEKLNGKALQRVDDNIAKVEKELEQLGAQGQKAKGGIDQATQAMKEQEEAARQQEAFESKIKQFLGLAGAAQVLRSALRNALSTITELDKTMTEMAVVTDLTVGDYWNQLPEYSKRASDLGVSINSAYQAATLYYQQGLKTNEVNAISTETLKMARIAGLSAEDATNKMTAALRGFNMELNETSAQKISDVYSELAAITAADVDEISSAMTKTASIASSAGMEFETTAAFLSQIIETTRESAETAGTAMKTVIARFQELKKSPDEIGEVDGEIIDANKIETALRSVGVALRDASGQFRDLDDVFLELSSKWDTLDTNTQRYIATIAAGSRQQSRFIAMMSDYGRTQELVTAANNSAGASNKQFEKTMDSLESKVAELKNAWQEFSMGILNSDLVKVGVEILTKFLNVINKMTGALDGVWGSAMKLISVISLFKLGQKIFDKFKNPLIKMFSDIAPIAHQGGLDAGRAFSEGVKEAKEELEGKKPESKDTEDKKEQKEGKTKDEQTFKQKASDAIGVTGITEGWDKVTYARTLKANQKKAQKNAEEKQATFEKIQSGEIRDDKGRKIGKNRVAYKEAEKEAQQAKKDLEDAEKAVASYDKTSEEAQKRVAEGWEQVGKGVQKMGATVAAVGIGVSAFGGILSSLGLKEIGEGFAQVGNILTLVGAGISAVGTALKAIPPLLTLISSHPIIAIVVAVLAVILASVIAIVAAIKNASPEAKLEKAQKAAENAAEAADAAAEAYDKLAESLDQLDGKYKALEDLTRGTKEWNEAVRGINSSVLDLISEYPELAKFVENKEGVLTIDVESDAVQGVLNQAEMQKISSKNTSIMANVEVAKAQGAVDYKNLDRDAKMGYKSAAGQGWGAFGTSVGVGAGSGAALGAAIGTAIMPGIGTAVLGAVGTVLGTAGGLIAGAIAGPIEAAQTKAMNEALGVSNKEEEKVKTEQIAKALAKGEAGTNIEDFEKYLVEKMGVASDAAGDLAKRLWENQESLREHGESLIEIDLQQQAAYDAIASSAQQLADTLGMTEEQIRQSAVVADGDLSGQFYQEAKNDLDEKYGDMKDKDFAKDEEVQEAIRKQYGDTAKIDKNGKVTYRKDGEDAEVTVTKEEVLGWMATQTATEKTTTAIEFSDEAIAKVGAAVGSEAIGNLYDQSEGKGLTKADITTLQEALKNGTLNEVWDNNMTADEKLVYGNDINNLIEDLEEGVDFATKSFEKAGDAARDFMTADMAKGFKEKLDEVASMAGGAKAYKLVQNATDNLLSGKDAQTQQEIQSRINMTDWSNLEELLALQLDLELQYGYTTEQAKAYVDKLGQASFATSGLTLVVQKFGEVYQATQKVNQSLQRLSDLQWEYNRALKNGGDIQELTVDMLAEYQKQASGYEEAYRAGLDDFSTIYATGATNYSIDLTKFVKLDENGVKFDEEGFRMDEAVASGKISESDAEKFIEELTKQYETNQSNLDGLRKTLENIEELEEEQKASYDEVRNLAEEAITNYLQKQIDLQQQSLDATIEANDKLINKLQEQINEDRRREQEEKAKENIANLQEQYAYLSRDTTGANSLQMLDLQSQIEQAEEDYTDSLIDQMIQDIQNSNQKAEEQRQKQIELSQKQLDAYTNSSDFQKHIDDAVQNLVKGEAPGLKEMITSSMTSGMTKEKAGDWATEFETKIGSAYSWLDTKWSEKSGPVADKINNIVSAIDGLPEELATDANDKALLGQRSKLESAGFNRTTLDKITNSETLKNLETYSAKEGSKSSLDSKYKLLQENGGQVLSQSEYYDTQIQKDSKGNLTLKKGAQTYDEYLDTQLNTERKNIVNSIKGKSISKTEYDQLAAKYVKYGGNEKDLEPVSITLQDKVTKDDGYGKWNGKWDGVTIKGYGKEVNFFHGNSEKSFKEYGEKLSSIPGVSASVGQIAVYKDIPYIFAEYGSSSGWMPIYGPKSGDPIEAGLVEYIKNNGMYRFATGGLADFTGPAWLDGTKSQPELVLNARDTKNFIVLKDILADILSDVDTKSKSSKSSGDNYFDIEINVDNISDDYDVEQLADKIRNMIYQDSIYRNVNTINHIR